MSDEIGGREDALLLAADALEDVLLPEVAFEEDALLPEEALDSEDNNEFVIPDTGLI